MRYHASDAIPHSHAIVSSPCIRACAVRLADKYAVSSKYAHSRSWECSINAYLFAKQCVSLGFRLRVLGGQTLDEVGCIGH